MSPLVVQNPQVHSESKSAKKKKAKTGTESPLPAATLTPEKAVSVAGNDNGADDGELPYIRELQKNIRNVNKKITNASKIDGIVAEHEGTSLDELVAKKVINSDQKTSYLNKPRLQSQLAQLEEQLQQVKRIDQEYRARIAEIREEVEKTLTAKLEKQHAAEVAEAKEKADAESQKTLQDSLLVLSQFLRLAAARRAEDANTDLDENRALEGVLLQVYSGDHNGVATMLKLVQGSTDRTKSVTLEDLETTYAQVKEASIAHSVPLFPAAEEAVTEAAPEADKATTDPTIAHATLTEISTADDVVLTNGKNGHSDEPASAAAPANADAGDSAANAAAESQWDAGNASMSASQEWVEVPRDPAETENGLSATPVAAANTQSWADDAAEHAADITAQPDPNDGFQSVQRNRGRGPRGNSYRGRGGFRGEGRGRGRGGRGGNGSFRGQQQRRNDDA